MDYIDNMHCIISSNNTDNGKLYIWKNSKWEYIFKFNTVTIMNEITDNNTYLTMYNGFLNKNSIPINNKYIDDSLKLYTIVFQKNAPYNNSIFGINNNISILNAIGIYQISYNIYWELNDDCVNNYYDNNKKGIFTFCNINNQFASTSMLHSSGNIFMVNAHNTFIYKNTILHTPVELFIYKYYEQYINDINIDSFSTSLNIKYLGI